ncbi:MAG TPA: hypothetical protein VNA88_00285 [Candidatus Kapabacteria bacterium]|jgi:hypothetical protein|nr:hypothetical protein [Candidatus Kapabacteria bacterium]
MNRVDDITIERYLDGRMDPAEQAAFKAQLATDASLRRRVASEESMIRALRADRSAARRDHAELRSRVLASIPVIAPAGAVKTRPAVRRGLYWPFIATVAIVAGWIAIDIAVPDLPRSSSSSSTTQTAQRDAVTPQAAASVQGISAGQGSASAQRADSGQRETSAQHVASGERETSAQRVASGERETSAQRATSARRETSARSGASSIRATSTHGVNVAPRAASTASSIDAEPSPPLRREIPKRTDSVARTNVSITPK